MHNGIDLRADTGQIVHAPFDMYIERTSKANAKTATSGIKFVPRSLNEGTAGFIWYFRPYDSIVGRWVSMGQPLGVVEDISSEYDPSMTNHIHIEQWAGTVPINITPYYV